MREYLIVYVYTDRKARWGFGNAYTETNGNLDYKAIRDIEAKIAERNKFKSVSIMNVIPLESEEDNEIKD